MIKNIKIKYKVPFFISVIPKIVLVLEGIGGILLTELLQKLKVAQPHNVMIKNS